jgi:hypothetical protein
VRRFGTIERSTITMAPVVPESGKIKTFRTEATFESWMRKNHAREREVWLRIYKKGSGVPSITIAEALDVVLCWGGIVKLRADLQTAAQFVASTAAPHRNPWGSAGRCFPQLDNAGAHGLETRVTSYRRARSPVECAVRCIARRLMHAARVWWDKPGQQQANFRRQFIRFVRSQAETGQTPVLGTLKGLTHEPSVPVVGFLRNQR